MASIGTLWIPGPDGTLGRLTLGVAAYGDLKVDVPQDYKHFEDNKKPEFLAKFPHGKVPAFEGKDGFLLFELFAVARYFAALAPNSGLLGSTPQEAAQVDQWTAHSLLELSSNNYLAYQLCKSILPYNRPLHTRATEGIARALKTVNEHLASRTFLVGERITLADIAFAASLRGALPMFVDAPLRKEIPNVLRHFETVVNHPKLKDVFNGDGKEEWVEKALQFTPPAKEKK